MKTCPDCHVSTWEPGDPYETAEPPGATDGMGHLSTCRHVPQDIKDEAAALGGTRWVKVPTGREV